ncbi:MAG: hypothetical protein LBB18_01240 [Puniceicoccales bacterium]|jgi:DNA repair exonuclease SbcCD ATPase subunit|nr:hypothetical protein [Puniceicoccales bacterium]
MSLNLEIAAISSQVIDPSVLANAKISPRDTKNEVISRQGFGEHTADTGVHERGRQRADEHPGVGGKISNQALEAGTAGQTSSTADGIENDSQQDIFLETEEVDALSKDEVKALNDIEKYEKESEHWKIESKKLETSRTSFLKKLSTAGVCAALVAITIPLIATLGISVAACAVTGAIFAGVGVLAVMFLMDNSKTAQASIMDNISSALTNCSSSNRHAAELIKNLRSANKVCTEQSTVIENQSVTIGNLKNYAEDQSNEISGLKLNNEEMAKLLDLEKKKCADACLEAEKTKVAISALKTDLNLAEEKANQWMLETGKLYEKSETQGRIIQEHQDAMASFVQDTRDVIKSLESSLSSSEEKLSEVTDQLYSTSGDVLSDLFKLRKYVEESVSGIKKDITDAHNELSRVSSGDKIDPTKIAETHKLVIGKLVNSIVKLGSMQEVVIKLIESARNTITDEWASMTVKLEEARKESTNMRANVTKAQENLNNAEKELLKEKSHVLDLKKTLDDATKSGNLLKEGIAAAKLEAENAGHRLDKLSAVQAEAQRVLEQQVKLNEKSEADLKKLESINDSLKKEADRLQIENSTLKSQNEELLEKFNSAQKNCSGIVSSNACVAEQLTNVADTTSSISAGESMWTRVGRGLLTGAAVGASALIISNPLGLAAVAGISSVTSVGMSYGSGIIKKFTHGILPK